jgi:hypothetical protein
MVVRRSPTVAGWLVQAGIFRSAVLCTF